MAISFSPCPQERIDVLPADYPTGRPARFAYLDDERVFHVVEASSGEKGPFRELASGPMTRDEALMITFYDNGSRVHALTLLDWARQVSTAVSPTAGWGVPVNSIEFQRVEDAPEAAVAMWITLAATSVGRGWDTVGHQPGVYRNRIEFE